MPSNLHEICRQGKLKKCQKIINDEKEQLPSIINTRAGIFGYTPLHEATSSRQHKIVTLLLDNGANVDATSNGNYTPLHIAASIGDVPCATILLQHNASVDMIDEYRKTPYRTAVLNRKSDVARLLKTAEVKQAVLTNSLELRDMIQTLNCGEDVTDNCFEECLHLAVMNNNHLSAGFIIMRTPSNMLECFRLAMATRDFGTIEAAAMLLLCMAAKDGEVEVLQVLCQPEYKQQQDSRNYDDFFARYTQTRAVFPEVLKRLREAVQRIDHAFPVSLACAKGQYAAAKILLFNLYCSEEKLEADWHGLAISTLEDSWIDDVVKYKKIFLAWNCLTKLPANIGNLKNVVRLDLKKNQLRTVPASLFKLPMLRNLNLSGNKIERLPEVDQWSPFLNILELYDNLLFTFPGNVSGLSIEFLNLAKNRFVRLPITICEISSLTNLDISYNSEIHELPLELGKLTKLSQFSMKGIQINDIPANLQKSTRNLIQHLRAKLRYAQPFYVMKLMLIGKANQGKTTLMHRLKGNESFNDNYATQGIDIQDMELKKGIFNASPFTFRVWDFAGQEDYYATHQCFLSARSLYLLIWDITKADEGVAELKPWLDNIAMRVPKASVIIVGTKLDKLKGEQQERMSYVEKMKNQIKKLLSNKIYASLNIDPENHIVCVTSVTKYPGYREHMENLKMLIYNVAEEMTTVDGVKMMGEKIPLSYRNLVECMDKLQKEKLQNNEIPIITREEFLMVARSMVSDRDTLKDEDIEPAVAFLHNIGSILHYNDPNQGLKDLFFISPSWLCKLMAKIITVKAANNFFKNGILQIDRIHFIIGKNEELFPPKFYERYMRLLYRFQIACKVDNHRILVPSKLSEKSDEDIEEVDDRSLLTRYHFFTCIPYGFWSRFMSRILLLMQEMLGSYRSSVEESQPVVDDDGLDEEDARRQELIPDNASLESEVVSNCDFPIINSIGRQSSRQPGLIIVRANVSGRNESPDYDTPDSVVTRYPVNYSKFESTSTRGSGSSSENVHHSDNEKKASSHPSHNADGNDSSTPRILVSGDLSVSDNVVKYPDSIDGNLEGDHEEDFSNPGDADIHLRSDHVTDVPDLSHSNDSDLSRNRSESKCSGLSRDTPKSSIPDWSHDTPKPIDPDQSRDPSASIDPEPTLFDDYTDLAYLIDRRYLKCWKNGLVFNHPSLYFSVQQVSDSAIPNRRAIETQVSDKPLGYRVLGFIVQHIRTLVKEWFTGLSGNDGESPYIMQKVACPICKRLGRGDPYLFDIGEAFASIYQREKSDYCLQCMRNHTPQIVDIKDLCPDLVFRDLSSTLQVDMKDLSYEESDDFLLGSGAYGKVYRGTYKSMQTAIKQYFFDDHHITTGLDLFYDIRQEVHILSKLRSHPFIVEYLGFATHPRVCAVMELASHGSIKDAQKDASRHIQRLVLFRILKQLTSALKFMHTRNIVHRDIKPDNILLFSLALNADVNVKLTDFGTANFMSPTGMIDAIGTPGYMAPEMFDYLSRDEYSCSVDIYSLGIFTCELITRRRPFHNLEQKHEISQALKNGDRPMYGDIPRSMFGLITLTDLATKLWQHEPFKRPTASETSDILSNLAFQLLYGKTALETPQNPRRMCCLETLNEIWILCDDKNGAWLTILDTQTSLVKQVLTIDGKLYGLEYFNLVNICAIDDHLVAIILRGEHDVLLTFAAQQRKIQSHHQFGELHVRSLIATTIYVFIGYQDGSVERFPKKNFLKGSYKKKETFRLTECHIQSMIANELYFIACCNNTLYQYNAEFKCLNSKSPLNQPIQEMILSQDGSKVIVSFQCSPQICMYDLETYVYKMFSFEDVIKEKVPEADPTDTRVTCMCQKKDVLWIGTGSGHVLIYQFQAASSELTFLNSFRPYRLEIRAFCVVPLKETDGSGVDCLVVTSGKLVNELAFGNNEICRLNSEFPADRAYNDHVIDTGTYTFASIDSKMILFWQLLSADEMKCVSDNFV